ncbi:alpha/beta hydrolase [Runella sp. MFBS21]|uniref:alpha/beta hydrolase n=1 Tax=Runella sp. MFBS21 TaxID=3034018 RepID=UPI0023F8C647|nr:alpha/beta hydrolase [Runella sp. MFBS21]MDF7817152.1 alpha/beta hydrolase [Runella sp. MFBS21]
MKKFLKWTAIVLVSLVLVYFVGPRPPKAILSPTLPVITSDLSQLEKSIQNSEASFHLKLDNEARIIWADTAKKQKTRYSIVYIHGFGASWAEGDPVHRQLAQKYGCNLYLARLKDAGLKDPDAFKNLTPENFLEGAKHALAVGKALGDSVILIGCSAGGLLSSYLAAYHPEIKALLLYSPCFKVNGLGMITGPWGQQLLTLFAGSHLNYTHLEPERTQYWLTSHHTNGLMTLQQSMDAIATPELFGKIKVPTLILYYYKDDNNQDKVVSVAAMQEAFEELGTPTAQKRQKALPNTGAHVIASHFTSKDLQSVVSESEKFLKEIVFK